ncbi:MAG: amidohydrolase [Lachnospiraceae bacterium]|nr:amidohydrolase [Lachnospiraceae bacterium]
MSVIYYNGPIITLEASENPEAVLEEGGLIKCVGTFRECEQEAAEHVTLYDLDGRCLMPAFLDAHSHLSNLASGQMQVQLAHCSSREEAAKRIQTFMQKNEVEPNAWIQANGYDPNAFEDDKPITLAFLDDLVPNNPLMISHTSGHSGLLNTPGLNRLGITVDTPQVPGGVIGQSAGKLTGYLEENAYFEFVKKIPMADIRRFLQAYQKAQELYASYGITTIQEGLCVAQMLPLLKALVEHDGLKLDLVGYVAMEDMPAYQAAFPNALQAYDKQFKIGGYKIFLDGSPQQRTAWMLTPYVDDADYFGYPTMSDDAVYQSIRQAGEAQVQILAHCNGDAACEQYLTQAAKIPDIRDIRPVIIHAQFLDTSQLERVKELGMIPSYFAAHIYHWGDVHIKNFGWDRARRISPCKSTLEKNILFTMHQDTPVILPDMLESIWCAVNRITKQGVVLGKEEAIGVYDALKAVTINAAYQYHEEDRKGSLKEGKQADFVVLSQSPMACDPMEIRKIRVEMTVRLGKVIYRRSN